MRVLRIFLLTQSNCTIHDSQGDDIYIGSCTTTLPSSGLTFSYNLWSSAPTAPAHTTTSNDQVGAPGFLLAGGRNAEDYKLTSTSLAKDHGTTLSYVTTDYARKPRSGAYDMGANEC
jgi:hypothetical protein